MTECIKVCMGILQAMGFGILFHVRGRKLVVAGVGGGLAMIVYLLVGSWGGNKALAAFAASIFASLLGECLARILKTPVIILLVPMLIPLIPGGDLYYTTSYLVRGQDELWAESFSLVLWEAGGIAFGIILVTCLSQLIVRILHWKNEKISLPKKPDVL